MLQTDIRKIDFWAKNLLKSHHVNLDTQLECVILFSSKDTKLWDLLYNKIIDALIDRVHPKNVYKDFSNALENINAFLDSWRSDGEKLKWLHAIVWVYHKKTFYFSTIGDASCYLHNTHKDIIEVTDKDDSPKNFNFISSWDIADGESLVLSTIRLLDILSKDDLRDGFSLWDLRRSGENIEHILLHEHSGKNVGLLSFSKEVFVKKNNSEFIDKICYSALKACDNKVTKKSLGYIYHLRDQMIQKSKSTKQVLLALGVAVGVFFLYSLISGFLSVTSNTQNIEEAKNNFYIAQDSISKASWNMNDGDMFAMNIQKAEEIIADLESKELFLDDVMKLKDDLWVLQKQFNGIEPFETNLNNTIYSFASPQEIVKVVSIWNKIYAVHKNSITGPIIQWEPSENFIFTELAWNDAFIDATVYDTNIILMTKEWKVASFAKNNRFSYVDVTDQATWENSPIVASYATNLYLLSDTGNQILRHKKQGNSYDAGVAYLSDDDAASIGDIISLAIDGWIYILKKDGSIVKLFRTPEYRLEWIVINKLPRNYNFETNSWKLPSIRARADLNNVYMLLDNKILIFKPNTIRYQDVTSLQYLGQVEWKDIVIEDFYVDNDDEIFIASSSGIYKLEYDVVDDDIILK